MDGSESGHARVGLRGTGQDARPAGFAAAMPRRVPGRHGGDGASSGARIRRARADDLVLLQEIERAAGEAFRGIGMAAVADDDPPTLEQLHGYQADGRAWVAVDDGDLPIGYALVDTHPADAHPAGTSAGSTVDAYPVGAYRAAAFVEQVSVHPSHRGRRIGAALLDTAQEWARERGLDVLVLTTFADVPWNAPYYRRLGFREVADADRPAWLRAIREQERARGLDAWPRVTLARPVGR